MHVSHCESCGDRYCQEHLDSGLHSCSNSADQMTKGKALKPKSAVFQDKTNVAP